MTVEPKGRILVVDDDRVYAKILTRFLEERGFEVLTAEDGVHAAWVAANERPGLILLDHYLPGADGLTVIDRLRRAASTRDIPIIYLTGSESESLGEKAKEDGVVAVFHKGTLNEDDFMWTISRVFGIKTARERWKVFSDEPEPPPGPGEGTPNRPPPPPPPASDGSDPWAG